MTEAFRPRIEAEVSLKNLEITPKSLQEDNQSKVADDARSEYERNAANGDLIGEVACGDARMILPLPSKTVSVRSISTAGMKDYGMFQTPKIGITIAISHIDGSTIEEGKMPTGCGGLRAKQEAARENPETVEGIAHYISKNIAHPDPIIQALVTANEIFKKSGKPTLAAVQDHLTTKIYPIGIFLPNQAPNAAINLVDLAVRYNPESIYTNLIPTLKDNDIPDIFREFLETANAQMKDILVNNPNFRESQKVQNPRMVVLSTEPRSMRIRYPKTASHRGIAFKMHLPRERLEEGISIRPEVEKDIVNQAEYPFTHSADHYEQPDKDFSDTDIFLIETGSMDVSNSLAKRLMNQRWMKEWLSQDQHQIWIAETVEGITSHIEPVKPVTA